MASECCQLSPELRQMVSIGVGIVIDWRRMVPIGVKWCQNGVNWRQLWSNGANWRQMVSEWCQMVPGVRLVSNGARVVLIGVRMDPMGANWFQNSVRTVPTVRMVSLEVNW